MNGKTLEKKLKEYYMDNKFSKSWINMRIQYDLKSRSDLLIQYLKKNYSNYDMELLDMCCGSGSFLIWSIKNKILFSKCTLLDYDMKLLKSIKSNLRKNLPKSFIIKSNSNNMNLILKKDNLISSSIIIKKNDCNKFNGKTKKFHVISYSAVLDFMSKSSIIKSLKKCNDNNAIFFSLCFNGKVRWTPTNTFDKYILSFFNKHQRTDKGFGTALGSKSIEFVKRTANLLDINVTTKNSPWLIYNKSDRDKIFLHRYLLDIKKALFHIEGIDKDILRKWYQDKKYDIENKSIKLSVGHQDILLFKK